MAGRYSDAAGRVALLAVMCMVSSACTLLIRQQPLDYAQQLDARSVQAVDLVVIHATETPDLLTARELAEIIHYPGSGTGNSGHFYIDTDGRIDQYVPLERVAHHVRGYNQRSIGIELVNPGRYPRWFDADHQNWTSPYPEAQLQALHQLLLTLQQRVPQLLWIARHSDLDQCRIPAQDRPEQLINRKLDPGASFPWQVLLTRISLKPWRPSPP